MAGKRTRLHLRRRRREREPLAGHAVPSTRVTRARVASAARRPISRRDGPNCSPRSRHGSSLSRHPASRAGRFGAGCGRAFNSPRAARVGRTHTSTADHHRPRGTSGRDRRPWQRTEQTHRERESFGTWPLLASLGAGGPQETTAIRGKGQGHSTQERRRIKTPEVGSGRFPETGGTLALRGSTDA